MVCVKEVDNKNRAYYFFGNQDRKKFIKNIHFYCIGCVTIKALSYIKTNIVNLLYLIINKMNGYIEERNGKNI